ncbi:MAG: hypothetical protein ACTS2F_15845 [Thainema sp.]
MFFLLPLAGAAVGAVAGALITHASGERHRQKAKYQEKIANELTNHYSELQNKYDELARISQDEIIGLTRQHAADEAEKDFLRLAVRLQQNLYSLMWDLDQNPTQETIEEFKNAVAITNQVLAELNEETIKVPPKYFSRNLGRAKAYKSLASSVDKPKIKRKAGRRRRRKNY